MPEQAFGAVRTTEERPVALNVSRCEWRSRTTPDGRAVINDLPARIGIVPGEVELVAQYMLDAIDALSGRAVAKDDMRSVRRSAG